MPDDFVTFTVTCPACSWKQKHTGAPEDEERIERILRAAFRSHFEFSHVEITREPPPPVGPPPVYQILLTDWLRAALLDILSESAPPVEPDGRMPRRDQLLRSVLDARPIGMRCHPGYVCEHPETVCLICGHIERNELPTPKPKQRRKHAD